MYVYKYIYRVIILVSEPFGIARFIDSQAHVATLNCLLTVHKSPLYAVHYLYMQWCYHF